jgi:hypothetical protein
VKRVWVHARPYPTQLGWARRALKTNQKGSFQVLAFIDMNSNDKWDASEKGITLPYILVEAVATNGAAGDRSAPHPRPETPTQTPRPDAIFLPNAAVATAKVVRIITGVTTADDPAVSFDADVTLFGGGNDGKRGLDRVFFGWNNNLRGHTVRGDYPANGGAGTARRSDVIFVTNYPLPVPQYAPQRMLINGTAPPPRPGAAGLALPLLDSRPPTGAALDPTARYGKHDGGIDVTFSSSPGDGKGIRE